MKERLSFKQVSTTDADIVRGWLNKEHVREFFRGQGLQNTFDDLDKWVMGKNSFFHHWIAHCNDKPFGYLMTSVIEKSNDPENNYAKWIENGREIISLDLLIGEEEFLGKGLACRMIQEFLVDKFPHVSWVFIDPSTTNSKAIHIYEKAGFKKQKTFVPKWDPVLHWIMRLDLNELRQQMLSGEENL